MNKSVLRIGVLMLLAIALGALGFTLVRKKIISSVSPRASSERTALEANQALLEIEGETIDSNMLKFEMSLHERSLHNVKPDDPGLHLSQDSPGSAAVEGSLDTADEDPQLGGMFSQQLKEMILGEIVERKIIYAFAKKDTEFDVSSEGLRKKCQEDWDQLWLSETPSELSEQDLAKYQKILCERTVVTSYIDYSFAHMMPDLEKMAREYYEGNPKEFDEPSKIQIRQIVLPSEEVAKKAQQGLTRQNFAARARELSITPEASNGGLLKPFGQGEMSGALDTAFTMQVGSIYGIVKSPYGFHIILLEKRIPARRKSFEEAKSDIVTSLHVQQLEQFYDTLLARARKVVRVETPKSTW